MTYLSPPKINALIDALVSGLPSLYATVQPTYRQEAFAAEANGILELVPPEHQLAAFERLEAIVLRTDGLTANLRALDPRLEATSPFDAGHKVSTRLIRE